MTTGAALWTIAAITAATATYSGVQSAHASKRQKSIANDQMKVASIEQANQASEAAKQRREQVDQQREMLNSAQRFSTSTKEKTPKDSGLRGRITEDVLG